MLTSDGRDLLYCSVMLPNLENISIVRYLLGIPGVSWDFTSAIQKAEENKLTEISTLLRSHCAESFIFRSVSPCFL